MIERGTGNLLDADVEALVNTVNTVGVMGKGIALQFKKAFPENFRAYERAGKDGIVEIGRMFTVELGRLGNPRFIVNFPTKRDWKHPSRLAYVESGLAALVEEIRRLEIRSIAIPPLGCGNGGLNWKDVRPLIEKALSSVPDVRAVLFEPAGAPDPSTLAVHTDRPALTAASASLIAAMAKYTVLGFELSGLEVQKLAYFLKEAGEPSLDLKFEPAHYGPYADALRHLLSRLDGHFVRGWGDGSNKPDVRLELAEDAEAEAMRHVERSADTSERLARVAKLIEGFESPYGMELLSSVHWVVVHGEDEPCDDWSVAADRLASWSERKRSLFRREHVEIAYARLQREGWLGNDC